MALQKQTVSLPFTQGLDTKTDDKLSVKLSRLENMVFRGGTLDKRYGTTLLTANIDSGGTFTTGEMIFPYDNELARINQGATYGLAPGWAKWVKKAGAATFFTATSNTRIKRNTSTQQQFDQATVNGSITVFAWVETSGAQQGVHVACYDETSGTFYQTGNTALASTANGQFPRCCVVGTNVFVFWVDGTANKVYLGTVDTTNPETVPVPNALRTDFLLNTNLAGVCGMDAIEYGTGCAVAYLNTTDPTNKASFTVMQVTGGGTVSVSPAPVTFSGMSGPANPGLNGVASIGLFASDPGGSLYVSWGEDAIDHAAQLWYLVLRGSFATILGKTLVGTGNGPTISVGMVGFGSVTAVYGTSTLSAYLSTAVMNSNNVISAAANIPGTLGMFALSRPVIIGGPSRFLTQSIVFAAVNRGRGSATTSVQPTAWVMDVSGNPIARALPGLCDFQSQGRLANAPFTSGLQQGNFLFSERGRLTYTSSSGQATDVTAKGITRVAISLVTGATIPVNRLGELCYYGGALPRTYDGQQVFEEGFPLPPEGLSATQSTGGSLTTTATYGYRALYSWVDARGCLHRSPPSPPLSVTLTGSNSAVTVSVPPLPLSSKDLLPQGATVQIELYRTAGNGTIYYRCSSTTSLTFNSLTAALVTMPVDTVSDSALALNELLYTTGGILDWLPPPAYKYATVFKSRLVIGGLEDPFECRFSSQVVTGEAVRFNEVFSIRVPSGTGPVVALATLDDKLIIFTSQSAYAVVGDGPDNLGNNPFPQPQQILPVDAGPTLAQSVATIPDGVVYQTPRGIMLLDRSLNVQYIGADVETYTSANTVRSALLRPEVQQLWLLCDSGNDAVNGYCLVWDYFYKQWSILTVGAGGGQASCYYQGKYTRVRSNGSVLQEQPGTYLDSEGPNLGLIQTNWIKLAGLQGFQRLWRATLLGKYNNSDFTLQWLAQFNYDSSSADTISFNTSGVFGSGLVPLQISRHMAQQKCESVRFTIADSLLAGDGHGMSLTGLELEYGVKRGAYKLPAAQSI